MNNLNSVLLEGNLTRDPLFKSTPKGTSVCNLSLATNRYFRNEGNFEKEVSFFEIEAWGKLADSALANGKKGRGIRVVGRLLQNRWTDNEGKNRSRVVLVAEHIEYKPVFEKTVKDNEPIEEEPIEG